MAIGWKFSGQDIPCKMFYKLTLDEKAEFLTLDLLQRRERPGKLFANRNGPFTRAGARLVITAKYKDTMDLLPRVLPVYHSYFKNLKQRELRFKGLTSSIDDDGSHL